MSELVVEVTNLRKGWGKVRAVDDVTFSVAAGEIFGLIAPDGAGKTTLFRILTTLYKPDAGTATVLGLDVVRDFWALRPRLGYMPGRFSLYADLTALENLTFYASVFGTTVAAQQDVIAPVWNQLAPFKDRRAGALSGGMKQKLALCCALVHRPDLLLLDEPTTGVDAVSRHEFWDLLGTLRDSGLTIVVSTPYMDEALRCDRVALMQKGRFLSVDTPATIRASYPLPIFAVQARERRSVLGILRRFPHAAEVWPFGEQLHYSDQRATMSSERIIAELTAWGTSEGLHEFTIHPVAATIEDVFIRLMTGAAA